MQIGSAGDSDFFLGCAGNFRFTLEISGGSERFFFPSYDGIFRSYAGKILGMPNEGPKLDLFLHCAGIFMSYSGKSIRELRPFFCLPLEIQIFSLLRWKSQSVPVSSIMPVLGIECKIPTQQLVIKVVAHWSQSILRNRENHFVASL